jgi:dsDNA-specific endonuclease/ATPase MutS2
MVDAVGTVAKIVEVALKIKGAADTVKQNEDECKQIKSRVEILSNTLSQHQSNTELMNNLAVRYALEALAVILNEACNLVEDCQEETSLVCRFYTSGKMSRQLIQVEQRISSKNVDAILAIMGFLLPKQSNQDGANPPCPQV